MSNLSINRVKTVKETIELLADPTVKSKLLSGGVSITLQIRNDALNCERLIDISKVEEIQNIEMVDIKNERYLQLGAGLSLKSLARNELLRSSFPQLISIINNCSDPARLNAFTLGGLLAVKRNQGLLFPSLAVLDALVVLRNAKTEKLIPFTEWLNSTEKDPTAMITAILIPEKSHVVWVVKEVKRRQMPGELIAGVIVCAQDKVADVLSEVRVVSVVDQFGVRRWTNIESQLSGSAVSDKLLHSVVDELGLQLQLRWGEGQDALYRRQVLTTLIYRCFTDIRTQADERNKHEN